MPETPTADYDAGFERAVDLASTVFGWQHLARYSGMSQEWLDTTLRAIVRSARDTSPEVPPKRRRRGIPLNPDALAAREAARVLPPATGREATP